MLYISDNDPTAVIKRLEAQAKVIFEYFSCNSLVANPTKTAFLMFSPGTGKRQEKYAIKVEDLTIIESQNEKILGV